METIKIKSTHPESQGEFVVINAADFKEGEHDLYVEGGGDGMTVKQLKDALTEAGVEFDKKAKKDELQALYDGLQSQE